MNNLPKTQYFFLPTGKLAVYDAEEKKLVVAERIVDVHVVIASLDSIDNYSGTTPASGRGARKCGKCGKPGHTSRTCKG